MASPPGVLEPGVLPYQEILSLCGLEGNELEESPNTGPIQPCRRQNVRSASYDLRLGAEFHHTDSPRGEKTDVRDLQVSRLEEKKSEHIVLPPNQVVVVSCLEKVCLPEDMVGHLSLKQDILLQGLIMASQSQIDAGYRGWIYPLLYNLTDGEVTLQLDRSVIRLELVRLPQPSQRPYDGDYQEASLAKSLKRPIGSSLTALRNDVERRGKEIDDERQRRKRTQWIASLIALVAIAVGVAVPFASGFVDDVYSTRDRVSRLEGKVEEPLQLDGRTALLKSRIAELQCAVQELEGKPRSGRC
jgi:deoxycytidine triphosphate deaminase